VVLTIRPPYSAIFTTRAAFSAVQTIYATSLAYLARGTQYPSAQDVIRCMRSADVTFAPMAEPHPEVRAAGGEHGWLGRKTAG
jgi:hypothetical protein